MIKQEWKKLLKNPILVLVLVVIMLIPSMYAGLFLSSMWDPYGELDKLPVAVVNKDQPVEFNGKTLNVGDNLVDNLKENKSLDFHFVSEKDAENGLKDGTYYLVITIPEDFSYKASTATDFKPETMQLLYKTNPATNYVATKLSQSAMNKIQLSLQTSISQSYIDALIDNINELGGGLGDAADGTSQILDGENKVIDGVDKISDGTSTLANGTRDLNKGALDLNTGALALAKGATTLKDGTTTLYNGANDLNKGANTLYNGSVTFQNGLNSYLDGTNELAGGINRLNASVPALTSGVASLDQGAAQLVEGNAQIVAGYEGDNGALNGSKKLADGLSTLDGMVQNAGTNPIITLTDDQKTAIKNGAAQSASGAITADNQIVQLVAAGLMTQYAQAGSPIDQATATAYAVGYVQQLASGVASNTAAGTSDQLVSSINAALPGTLGTYTSQLSTGATALNTGLNTLYGGSVRVQTGLTQLHEGTSTLNNGSAQLANGAATLNQGANRLVSNNETLRSGAASITSGASALNDGSAKLKDGANSLNDGATQLSDGSNTLAEGTTTLYEGTNKLNNGANELNNGVSDLKDALPELSDGTNTLYTSLDDGSKKVKDANLGEANSAMMASPVETVETQITTVENNGSAMAAYMMSVGLWVACLAFCLMYPLTEHENLKNGFAWWASKASVLFPIAVLQGVALVFILKKFLGFDPVDLKGTIFVAILSSIAFMAIMYYFNALIGKVGSFIMLVFMVFQLAGSAGTYPIELSGPLAQALHKFVPFTYTVNAFRSAIGGGESYYSSIVVLVAIIIVFTTLTLWLFQGRSLMEKHNKPNVHDWLDEKGLA